MLRLSLFLLLLYSCSDQPPTTPETRPVENPNAGNTAIYDVDADDPYEIGDGAFMEMRPGGDLAPFSRELEQGDAGHFYIKGRRGDRLGYLIAVEESKIGSIHLTSTDVVTRDGLRVGNTFAELVERIGKPDAIEQEGGRACARKDRLAYCLDATDVLDSARVVEIVILP
ncbi:hypothetical protein GGR28_000234 [Lewinella aquimaris]|uniref:Uncharacterized protein n=1 Tax=Neolewinella aquimaris TaxID=1835722 RepID=A0A840E106_9BACT|nr:hypothetical protein [Neolewinella aquimaris]MBB4077633.1 hypothetical protein [Neolewinella aquimaris]